MITNKIYELTPRPEQGRKSFYNKAYVEQWFDGEKLLSETLYSYGKQIIRVYPNGVMERLWDDWSQTTGRHIYAFCLLNKNEFLNLKPIWR